MSEEQFNRLLTWLDPERERAGERYEEIRRQLIKIFVCRGCTVAEELADETINRVTRKIHDVAATYVGSPALYFYGVARLVHLEYVRRKPEPSPPEPPPELPEDSEAEYECLERCMRLLSAENRELILRYYEEDEQTKIDQRKQLAERLGMPLNALRIRAHRIRQTLRQCVDECLRDGDSG